MIIDHPEMIKKYIVSKERHYTVQEIDVIALEVADQTGSISFERCIWHKMNTVEYLYAFPERDSIDKAIMIFKFDHNDKAIEVMQQNKIKILEASECILFKRRKWRDVCGVSPKILSL